jgi:colanic acid/amylovoran biosynthesis glycosyltransferase
VEHAEFTSLKVAFATYDAMDDVGGVSSWLRRLVPYLQKDGIDLEIHLLAFGGRPGVNFAWFEKHGVTVRWRPWRYHTRKAVRDCLQLVEEGQPDVYVPSCILPAYYAAGYLRGQGLPTVGVIHSDDPFYWGIVDEFVNGLSAFRLSALVTVSTFLEGAVQTSIKQRHTLLRKIGYGVPIAESAAKPPNGVFRLIYSGRLVEQQKRISEVTEALCAVVKANPDVEAWMVGEGDARSSVETIIQASGVGPERVKVLGRVDVAKMYGVLQQCHAFVLLSDYEGLPVAMLEAMAAGVVPICLDIRSGVREAILPGVNGLIVQDRSADFHRAVMSLQRDLGLWARLSANARTTATERFSEERCGSEWSDLLRSIHSVDRSAPLKAPFVFKLPRRNPKFGGFDSRPTPFGASARRVHASLGNAVRKMQSVCRRKSLETSG